MVGEIFQKAFYFILYPHWLSRFVGLILICLVILLIVNWITQNPKTKKHMSTLWKGIYTYRKKILIPIVSIMLIAEVILSYIMPIETPKLLQKRVTDIEAIVEKVQNEIVRTEDRIGSLAEKTQKLGNKVELLMRKRPRIILREPSETDPYIPVDQQCLSVFAEISDDYGIEESSINLMLDNEVIKDKPHIEKVSDTLLHVDYTIIRSFTCRPYYVILSAKNILGAENTITRRVIIYYPVEEWTFLRQEKRVLEHHEEIELTAENIPIEWTSKKRWPGDIIIECWVKFTNSPPNFGVFFNSQYEVVFGDGNNDSVIFKGGLGGPKVVKCSEITGFPFQLEKVYHLKIKRVKGSVSIEIDGKSFAGGWKVDKICPKHLDGTGIHLYPHGKIYLSGFYLYSPPE